jgi:adhesin transport system membrane fusion protein
VLKSSSVRNNKSSGPSFRERMEGGRLSIIAVLVMTILLFVWMSLTDLSQVVRVEGKIIPAGKGQQIQHLEGGIISSIDVQEGQSVHKGDALLTIDSTLAGASQSETKLKLDGQLARAARLKAEVDNQDEFQLPKEWKDLQVANAELQLFHARHDQLDREITVQKTMLTQRISELEEARSRKARLSTEMLTATERMNIVVAMSQNGAASKLEVLDAKGREQSLKTQFGDVGAMVPKLEAAIKEAQARIEEARSNFRADAQNEYVATLSEIERLKQMLTAADDRMKRTEVKAPVDGVINSISVNTVGGVVKPGEVLLEITPSTQTILIEAKASPKDRGYLHTGLTTQIRVLTYDPAEFGTLSGKVTKIGADSLKDSSDQPYYQVNILVDKLPNEYTGKEMIPGMTIIADIVTGKRTILSYLLSPLHKFTYNMFRDPR